MKAARLVAICFSLAGAVAKPTPDLFEIAIDTAGYGNNNVALIASLKESIRPHRTSNLNPLNASSYY